MKKAKEWFFSKTIEERQELCKEYFPELGMNATLLSDSEISRIHFIETLEATSDKDIFEDDDINFSQTF